MKMVLANAASERSTKLALACARTGIASRSRGSPSRSGTSALSTRSPSPLSRVRSPGSSDPTARARPRPCGCCSGWSTPAAVRRPSTARRMHDLDHPATWSVLRSRPAASTPAARQGSSAGLLRRERLPRHSRRRGAGAGRPDRRRSQAGARLLAGHATAPRSGDGALGDPPVCSCSTSRPTGWTRRVSPGSEGS